MKAKKQLLFLIALLGGIAAISALFLKTWAFNSNGKISANYTYTIFQSVPREIEIFFEAANKSYAGIWSSVYLVFAALGVVLFIVFIAAYVLNKRSAARAVSFAIICSAILALASGALYTAVNSVEVQVPLVGNVYYAMNAQIGFFVMCVGLAVSGVFGFIAAKKSKAKRKRK